MRSEWVSKLTLIQQAEMAIVSAHNSKQTELRCEVFLWIQIILSFFFTFLTFFCGLHCSIPYTSQQQDLFVTTHCTHTITLCTDIFSSSGCILLFMQEKRSLTISGFFFSLYWRQGLPHCHPVNYFTFLIPVTHLTQTLFFFFSRSFQISVWNTGSSGEASAAEGPQCAWAPRTRDRGRVNSSSPCFLTLAVLCCVTFQTRLLSKLKWKWKTKDAVTAGIWALFASEDEEGAGV